MYYVVTEYCGVCKICYSVVHVCALAGWPEQLSYGWDSALGSQLGPDQYCTLYYTVQCILQSRLTSTV